MCIRDSSHRAKDFQPVVDEAVALFKELVKMCIRDSRSIVVMDGAGRYYHVEKGKSKRYIATNLPRPGEQDFDTAVKKLKEEAGQRAEETDRQKRRNEEAKRRKRLEEIRDALPYLSLIHI